MNLKIEIDKGSGFCNGVVRAIKQAENYLNDNEYLYSLGAIVHNRQEINRLQGLGMRIIDVKQMSSLHNEVVLVRAHGEPPTTYAIAQRNGIRIIDCTCPVVLRLQERIADVYKSISRLGGQVVIFGKRGHAEVNGLVGQTEGNAIVVESVSEIGSIDFSHPVAIFSQTTKDPAEYQLLIDACPKENVQVYNTICKQVEHRHSSLVEFASRHDVILFVSGNESSNGKVLYDLCSRHNSRCYHLESLDQLDMNWFKEGESVGICGATSTPHWQLEQIENELKLR